MTLYINILGVSFLRHYYSKYIMTILVTELKKSYEHFEAVKGISFEVKSGEIVAILGTNGAGKSTTLKMLCGLLKPTAGTISIDGHTFEKDANAIRQKIGYMPEESALYEDVTIDEYLQFFAELFGISRTVAHNRITKLKRDFELPDTTKQIASLSKGMKRKVLLIRALLNDPSILIFDEPASGLDPNIAHSILEKLLDLKKQQKTILFSSHNLLHVEKIADRVIIIDNGKIIFNGNVSQLKKTKKSQYKIIENGEEKTVSFEYLKKNIENISAIEPESTSLEEAFLSLTK